MYSILGGVINKVLLNHHFPNGNKQVILAMDEKICHLSTKLGTENVKTLRLKKKIITQESKMLHNKFVVVSIDKASGYSASVC